MSKANRELLLQQFKKGKKYSDENPKIIYDTISTLFGEEEIADEERSMYWIIPNMTADEVETTVKCALSTKGIAMEIFYLHAMISEFEDRTIIRLHES